jgi:hypothetical protein
MNPLDCPYCQGQGRYCEACGGSGCNRELYLSQRGWRLADDGWEDPEYLGAYVNLAEAYLREKQREGKA